MGNEPALDSVVMVRGIGEGYVALVNGDRVTIEFTDGRRSITIPYGHLGTDCYELTGERHVPNDETATA